MERSERGMAMAKEREREREEDRRRGEKKAGLRHGEGTLGDGERGE